MSVRARLIALLVPFALCVLGFVASASAYDVVCQDGWISHSGGKQGACSSHGGVAGPVSSGGTPVTPATPTVEAPPPDTTAPTVAVTGYVAPAVLPVGVAVQPFVVTVADDRAWPAGAYSVLITWGDGTTTVVPFAGVAVPAIPVAVTVTGHAYPSAGSYSSTATVVDPAGNQSVVPIATAVVTGPVVRPAGYPRLSGTPRPGRILRCATGVWGGTDPTLAITWLANGHQLPYRGHTYRVRSRDVRRRISCKVTGSNVVGAVNAVSNSLRVNRPAGTRD